MFLIDVVQFFKTLEAKIKIVGKTIKKRLYDELKSLGHELIRSICGK
jgi:hypothetical protein